MIFKDKVFEKFVMFLPIGNIGLVLLDFDFKVGRFQVVGCFVVDYFADIIPVADNFVVVVDYNYCIAVHFD